MTAGRVLRWFSVWLLLAIISVPATIAILGWRQADSLTLPGPTGPFAVGRLVVDWRDDERTDPFAPTPGTKRELPAWIWYPAARDAAYARAPYMPQRTRDAIQPRPPLILRLIMEVAFSAAPHASAKF